MRKSLLASLVICAAFNTNAQDNTQTQPLEIVIAGGLAPIERSSTGSSVTVITEEDIQKKGYQNAGDVLRSVPGVSVTKTGSFGGVTSVRLRGAESNQVLVLIDGIEANAGGSSFDFANLLTDNIERIEVLKGEQSALWGSDAMGGVINIITKSGKGADKAQYNAGVEYGSFKTRKINVGTLGDTGALDYAVSVSNLDTDGYSSASDGQFTYNKADGTQITTGGNTEDDGYSNTTANVKLGFDVSENFHLEGVVRYTDFETNFDSFLDVAVDGLDDRAEGKEKYYLLKSKFLQLDGKLAHTLKATKNQRDSEFFSSFGASPSESEKSNYAYQLDYSFGSQGISVALESEEDSIKNDFSGARSSDTSSLVTEYRYKQDGLAFQLGGRYDDNDLFDSSTTYRAALSYNVTDASRLHTSYGKAIKNPTLIEVFGFSPEFIGNAAIQPEESVGGDIGYEFTSSDKNHVFDITYFNRTLDNIITGSGEFAFNLEGETDSSGLELTYNANLFDVVDFDLGYTYNKTEDSDGNQLVRAPEQQLSIGVGKSLLDDSLTLNANARFVMDRTDLVFNPDFTTSTVEMDDYMVVDASSTYKLTDNVNLSLRIENLLDEEYEEVISYGTSERAFYLGFNGQF